MLETTPWLVIGLTALGVAAVLGWRRPTALLLLALVTFAVGPEGALRAQVPPDLLRWMVPAQQALLVVALLANLRRHGRRRQIRNWPLMAVVVLVLESLLLAKRSELLGIEQIMLAALALALPWTITAVVLEPHSRQRCALLVALLPIVSLAVGVALALAGMRALGPGDAVTIFRLPAATHPSWFGVLAFAGFALAGHEALRGQHIGFAALAVIDLALAVAGGGQTAAVACLGFVAIYVLLAEPLRSWIRREGRIVVAGGAAVVTVLIFVLPLTPLFVAQSAADEAGALAVSISRERIWGEYMLDFLFSPVFGQGLGASTLVGDYADLPRNEYLRLLAEAGLVGLLLYLAAIVFWGLRILAVVRTVDSAFVLALFGTLALVAAVDNLLIMTPTLVLFVYLGCIARGPRQQRSSQVTLQPSVAGSASRRSTTWAGGADIPVPTRWPPASFAARRRREAETSAPAGPIEATLRSNGVPPVPPIAPSVGSSSSASLATEAARPAVTPPAATGDGPAALAARIRRQIELGDLASAGRTLGEAPEELRRHAAVEGARAALGLAEQARVLPALEVLLGRLEADDDDQAARIDLATALFARKQPAEAIDLLVAGVRRDREWRDQAARKLLLEMFSALGAEHPATLEGRRRLAAVLFA